MKSSKRTYHELQLSLNSVIKVSIKINNDLSIKLNKELKIFLFDNLNNKI